VTKAPCIQWTTASGGREDDVMACHDWLLAEPLCSTYLVYCACVETRVFNCGET
jgi:hypothetical protein